ncbi:MAG: hypothetical protein GEU80_08820 [Dehalococcoidia bacterium]|nr:hypothetical protein [Dehalococcoidia bacterium]
MSFGALSGNAVRALSGGAADAGCAINSGEGGLSPHHLSGGGDVIFQVGPAKYGVRTPLGATDWGRLRVLASAPQVRAIEIKLGQGAKPGKGGILPGVKVTPEIAAIRGIEAGEPSHSPNRWSEFRTMPELIDFIERVKDAVPIPVGVKVVVGDPRFLDELARERAATGRGPDYVSVDGAEGGTGAAPLSLTDHMGVPLHDAVVAVDDAYRRHGVREDLTVIAAGRAIPGAEAAYAMALGADLVNIGRRMRVNELYPYPPLARQAATPDVLEGIALASQPAPRRLPSARDHRCFDGGAHGATAAVGAASDDAHGDQFGQGDARQRVEDGRRAPRLRNRAGEAGRERAEAEREEEVDAEGAADGIRG